MRRCHTSTEENKRIAVEFWEAFGRQDVDKMSKLLAEDANLWTPGTGTYGKQYLLENVGPFISNNFPKGLKVTVDHCVAEGDYVAAEGHSYGETRTGKIYQNKYHWLFEIRGGKIWAFKEYLDTLHVKEVLSNVLPENHRAGQ
jgi:uncharacterized protein